MIKNQLFNESHEATYCPEDDKIRLYVGRVPKDEYLALRKEGWKITPKQDCDFVAHWCVARENTAISYAGVIGDEDQSPTDRASDRADRFSGYLDKRRSEAHEHAGAFNSQPLVHGYQNLAKAEKAANRHDRLADKAVTQWSKAEYWQSRTAGVISNALYKSTPGVRQGRIKILEAGLRRCLKSRKEYDDNQNLWKSIGNMKDEAKALEYAHTMSGTYRFNDDEIYDLLKDNKLTGKEASELYLERHPDLKEKKSRNHEHVELRLAYERQMLEAAGGLAGELEMKVGGWIGSHQIHKVNKSSVTKQVISVWVLAPKVDGYHYLSSNIEGTEFSYMKYNVERMDKGGYRDPSPGDIEKVLAFQKELKSKIPKKPSLINPTKKEAERLQKIWNSKANERERSSWNEKADYSNVIAELSQKGYSSRSGGSCSPCETIYLGSDGNPTYRQYYGNTDEGAVCKVRMFTGGKDMYQASRVICITDKAQKKLPKFSKKKVEVSA